MEIHKRISMVMVDVGAIAKSGKNEADGYMFRSIDDVYDKLQPVLGKHGVFFLPSVLESKEERFKGTFEGKKNVSLIRIKLKVKYSIFAAEDGSTIETTVEGEAIDDSDKATNKALTAAFKYMLIQVFCIAVKNLADADRHSPEIKFVKGKSKASSSDRDWKITEGKYRGKRVSEIPADELKAYVVQMNSAAKAAGKSHPKWFAELARATGFEAKG